MLLQHRQDIGFNPFAASWPTVEVAEVASVPTTAITLVCVTEFDERAKG